MATARLLFGLVVLLVGLAAYALLAMKLAVEILPDHLLWQTLYYIAAGILWVPLAIPLVRWMQRRETNA